jgi:hypothetical protein
MHVPAHFVQVAARSDHLEGVPHCTGVSDRDISVALQEVSPSQAMENGMIMPDVGHEKAPS